MANFRSNFAGEQFDQAVNFVHTQVAEPYASAKSYAVDDYVVYEGLLYQCKGATTGTFDSTKWQVQKIFDNNGYVIIK